MHMGMSPCSFVENLFQMCYTDEIIQAHKKILDLSAQEALTALERLTHVTFKNPHPVMSLSEIVEDAPALFHRAAIHAALGSARSFYTHLQK